ncbi:MAG: chemotaxis protein CheD [Paracoccaceae bacterium]
MSFLLPDPQWDQTQSLHVLQGEFLVSSREDDVLTTILGSCVSTCLCDPVAKVGGMNHFLLPDCGAGQTGGLRYGSHAMELLINGLLKMGAVKGRLQGKLFGAALMNENLVNIGKANAAFALQFLATEGIPCVGQSLGGIKARRIRFWPTSGKAQQLVVDAPGVPASDLRQNLKPVMRNNDVTFF